MEEKLDLTGGEFVFFFSLCFLSALLLERSIRLSSSEFDASSSALYWLTVSQLNSDLSPILISLIRHQTRLVPFFKASLAFSTRPTSRASSATSNVSRTLTLWLNCCWFPGLVICLVSISYCRESCPTSSAKNVS